MRLSVFTYLGVLVFSLLAMLVALGFAVLFNVGPMAPDAPVPGLERPPGLHSGLGAALPVEEGGNSPPALAASRIAGPADRSAERRASGSVGSSGRGSGGGGVAVSSARPVAVAVPVAEAPGAPPREEAAEEPAPAPATAAVPPAPVPDPAAPLLVANFESGLDGWTAPRGDRLPRLSGLIVRDGTSASVVRLVGEEDSSRLILGGDGRIGDAAEAMQFGEGAHHAFAFSFHIDSMVYGQPGADNMVMRIAGGAGGASLGLHFWDFFGNGWSSPARGLWSDGEATAGPRFLGPVTEHAWHDVVVHFTASSQGAGFYEVYLDGVLVDARQGVSLIPAGGDAVQIEVGLMRDGTLVEGSSEIRIDAAKLGDSLESVLP